MFSNTFVEIYKTGLGKFVTGQTKDPCWPASVHEPCFGVLGGAAKQFNMPSFKTPHKHFSLIQFNGRLCIKKL